MRRLDGRIPLRVSAEKRDNPAIRRAGIRGRAGAKDDGPAIGSAAGVREIQMGHVLRKIKITSFKTKLVLAISVITVILLFAAFVALISQKMITDQLSRMTETTIVTNDILNTALALPYALSKYDMIRLKLFREQIDQSVDLIKDKLQYLQATIHDQYGIAQLALLNRYFDSCFDYVHQIEAQLSRGGKMDRSQVEQLNKRLDSIQTYVQQLDMVELHYYSGLKKRLDYQIGQTWLFSILAFVCGGFCLGFAIKYINKTANTVVEISHLAHNIADGDLSVPTVAVQAAAARSEDELSVLARSFNKMAENLRDFRDNLHENLPPLREHFFRELAEGKIAAPELPAYRTNLQLELREYCTTVMLQLDDYYLATFNLADEERARFRNEFAQTVAHALKDEPAIFFYENHPGEYVLCVTDESPEQSQAKTGLIIEKIRADLKQQYSVTVAVGNCKASILAFSESYSEAARALSHKFILGRNQNIFFRDLNEQIQQQQTFPSLVQLEAELVSAIKLADIKLIEQRLGALIAEIRARGAAAQLYLKMIIGNIYLQALQTLQQANSTVEEVFDDPLKEYQKIIAHQTIDGMGRELLEVLTSIVEFININKGRKFYQMIAKAQEYLLKNYSRGDLSLEEVANVVHVSSCYFSLIFKQEVGTTFVDYLTKVRIEKAKELLAIPGNLSYEVSYQVGYNNPNYFSTLFKKHVGLSPTEFKNQSAQKK